MADQIEKNRQDFGRKIAEIRSNPDLSEQARRRMLQEVYDAAARRHRELVEEEEARTAEKLTRLERDVMGIRYPLGTSDAEKETIRMSYRDAYDRAYYAGFDDPAEQQEELATLLERAERSGDRQLADAVYHVATERGVRKVADSYLSGRPEEAKRWEAYTTARIEAESDENLLFGARASGPARPAELDGHMMQTPQGA